MKKIFLVFVLLVLTVGLVSMSGCLGGEQSPENGVDENGENGGDTSPTDDEDSEDGAYSGTGTETFSGTWEGESATGDKVSGTWEFTVDWENEDVSGSFEGDASGDISGSVSEGEITAEGEAASGAVIWWGTFNSDGSEASGEWEIKEEGVVAYSGTWSGQKE